MNSKGEIREFKTDEEAQAAGYGTKLSHEEAGELEAVPESERQLELLWIRFWRNQRKLRKPGERMAMRHAFITGYRIGIELKKANNQQGESNG